MNIYLACTVRGDRAAVVALRGVADALERDGHTVVTRHLLAGDADTAESASTERDVFDRDMDWLCRADLLIRGRRSRRFPPAARSGRRR